MSCQKIKSKLKNKGVEVEYLHASLCCYGGGWAYFLLLAEGVEQRLLEIDSDIDIESQFDSKEDALKWVEQLPNLKGEP